MPTVIIEFKGWWNRDKNNIVNRLQGYMTDFDREGYLMMINHTSKNISEEYKEMICNDQMNYIPDTWEQIGLQNSDFFILQKQASIFDIKNHVSFCFQC
jgi:hypothetical protein